MQDKKDKGFTLVELLIVIVILGILATVTVFAVRGITDKGQTNACEVEQRTVETAIEAFYADTGAAPADDAWGSLSPAYLKETSPALSTRWSFTGGSATMEATVTPVPGGKCA